MNVNNWDTYYFFQQQEIKRALHQYALGLFLKVWEEGSAIFIDYLINSPLSSFLMMLAVFSRKEYEDDVGNLSPIHLFGKLCQLSKQSLTELFDLIRNNALDIIKPEEGDYLIKEVNIKHKDYLTQVQFS